MMMMMMTMMMTIMMIMKGGRVIKVNNEKYI